jgi:hypothetical protein
MNGIDEMKKLDRVLSLMFQKVEAPRRAKEALKRRLFDGDALSDEDASSVAAAGTLTELKTLKTKKEE